MQHPELQHWLNGPNGDIDSWLNQGLKIGLEYLQLETGIVSKIVDDQYVIRAVRCNLGDIFSPGDHFDLSDTYCAEVVKTNKTVTYIQVGAIPKMVIHPVYKAMQLETYIGSALHDQNGRLCPHEL